MTEMSASTSSQAAAAPKPGTEIRRLLTGLRLSLSISVAASLGVADALAGGPRSIDDLASTLGCDTTALYRLLRALAAAGILHEDAERRFTLTELGEALRSDVEGSAHEQAILFGRPYVVAAWGNL